MCKFGIATAAVLASASLAAAAATLFEQGPSNGLSVASDSIDPAMFVQADNFSLAEDAVISSITFAGEYQATGSLRPDAFTIGIYADSAGLPSPSPVFETTSATIVRTQTGPNDADYEATFASPLTLLAGDYWLAIENATADPGSSTGRWGWMRINTTGPRARIWGAQSPDWEAISNGDLAFSLCGGPVTERLVHFWDFEGGGGDDHAGGGDGTVGASAVFAGPDSSEPHLFALGNSLTGGVDTTTESGVSVPNGSYFQFDQSGFTLSFAYKRDIGDTASGDIDLLFDTFLAGRGWQVYTVDDTMRFYGYPTNSGQWWVGSGPVGFDPAGEEWRHFTFRCDRDGLVGWFVDGVETEFQFDASIVGTLNNTGPMRIGFWQSEGQPFGLDGCLDRVRVYNYALSDSEIAALAREVVVPDAGCQTDFNNDGATDSGDLATLLAAWGVCP